MEKRTLPKTDSGLASWSGLLIEALTHDAASLGITPALRDEALTAHAAFAEAYEQTASRQTRTMAGVVARKTAAARWRRVVSQVVSIIRAQADVSDARRAQIGIPPRAANVSIGVPTDEPNLLFRDVKGRTVHLLVTMQSGTRRGRPANVAGVCSSRPSGNSRRSRPGGGRTRARRRQSRWR